jgi:hypothetical protein
MKNIAIVVKENEFTVEDGIKVQTEQLEGWKKILRPAVYNELRKWATKYNDKAHNGYDIARGITLDNFIGNYMLGHKPNRIIQDGDFKYKK